MQVEPVPAAASTERDVAAYREALEAQGLAVATAAELREAAEVARHRFDALLATPGLPELLRRLVPVSSDEGAQGDSRLGQAFAPCCWDRQLAASRPVPRIAADCAEALRRLAPRLLATDERAEPSDARFLLASFSERYDVLFAEHEVLRRRCRALSERQPEYDRFSREVETWQTAYGTASARVEQLSLESADHKERLKQLHSEGLDSDERNRWRDLVAQREAEIQAIGSALRQLQEVVEEGGSDDSMRCARLHADLREARLELERIKEDRGAISENLQKVPQLAAAAAVREQELLERCRCVEAELHENGAAIEALLREKARHLEEREYLVDKRLVTSTLSSCLEHLASGQKTFAEQVISQALRMLGGEPEELAGLRRQLREVTERQRTAAEPLGDAFLDFLTREASDGGVDRPQGAALI